MATQLQDEQIVRVTSKGQVFVHKALREKGGVKPGERVRVGRNERGDVVIRPLEQAFAESKDEREARIRAAIRKFRGKYATGRSTDEIMREIRGEWEP